MSENHTTAKLKQTLIFVTIIVIVLITWSQLSLLKEPEVIQDNTTVNKEQLLFQTEVKERDPPSWFIQTLENEPLLKQPSIFPVPFFSKYNEKAYPFVSAVINRIDDTDEGIVHAVNHLMKYPFIKEILIHNQITSRPLQAHSFYPNKTNSDVRIEIIKADNTSTLGKFSACALASFGKCYFQDDLWLNTYLDSLYTHSFRYSDHFVVNARPVNYIDYSTWRFQNSSISLHAGFADLRYGAFIPQYKVQTFLSQLSAQGLEEWKLKFADVYFSIWLNQYPYMIFNPLLSGSREKFKHTDTVNNRLLTQHVIYDAVSILEKALKNKTSAYTEDDYYFDQSNLTPVVAERDVRSTCANDKCLFITNMDEMPHVLDFNSEQVSNISEFETRYNNEFSYLPDKTAYIHQAYHKAVDQNTETCWKSIHSPKEGDYFGLYMMGDLKAGRVMIYTSNTFDLALDKVFKVQIQFVAFGSWEECDIKLTPYSQLSRRIGFKFECPDRDVEPFKSIRISFAKDLDVPFELCGLGLDNFVV